MVSSNSGAWWVVEYIPMSRVFCHIRSVLSNCSAKNLVEKVDGRVLPDARRTLWSARAPRNAFVQPSLMASKLAHRVC
jgi:CRISPR/Cas system CMR subunit Cmr4 (Cas7 group RAMP superfamily)